MTAADAFCPWARNLDTAERLSRLRAIRAIVCLTCGRPGEVPARFLDRAERDAAALVPALNVSHALALAGCRHVLASDAALHRRRP
ncbi:hypothetical protein DK389_04695 [Methylobacterium durans]|uniref:Uncharacterized protein n=1 Tax=Methylobacterium durans TaxID=2202825 RepID=A0A2U8W1M2_9HYPH|nr:hypothetical protein DK389_04695 [Methylobacterium durans]